MCANGLSNLEGIGLLGARGSQLLLKQILERCPRIVGLLRDLARRFLLQPHAHGKERAVISFVFGKDSFRDGLIALKLAGGIEVLALFAGVQFEAAFLALS